MVVGSLKVVSTTPVQSVNKVVELVPAIVSEFHVAV